MWTAKNFKISEKFLSQSRQFDYLRAVSCLPKETLIILGNNDVLVDKTFAEDCVKEFGFDSKLLSAGHALLEDIDSAKKSSANYFNN